MIAFILFLSSFQFSNAEVLKTYTIVKNNEASKATIYREPTIHSDTLYVLPIGSKGIIALAKPRKYGNKRWQHISWNGMKGWMLFKHLKYDRDTSLKINEQSCKVSNLTACL
jgi:hypothetical protein